MVISTDSLLAEHFAREFDAATVYADVDSETVLHEGGVRVLANGWVELDTGRLLAPDAVHHVDPHDGP